MNDELPKLPSIDFEEFDAIESSDQVAQEELSKEFDKSISRRRAQSNQNPSNKSFSKLFLFALFIFAVGSVSYISLGGKLNGLINIVKINSESQAKDLDTSAEVKGIQSNRTFNLNSTNKIAYVSSGNVWIMDYDGKDKNQITRDGGILKSYKNVEWKNSRELSFTSCTAGECKVYVFNLVTDTATEILSLQVPQINLVKWSPTADVLLINYIKPNGALESSMWKNNVQTVLRQYSIDQNISSDFNDEINFVFSDDGQYFAAINTLVNSAAEDQVIIYDINANQIATISGETSFAVFSRGNNIYFKSENKVFRGKIGSIQSQIVLDSFNSFELHLSKDGNIMTFWNLREEVPVTSFYNLTTGELRDIANGFKSPRWLNENVVIGLQVNNYKGLYSYEIQKLASTDINGNIKVLEENNVTEFDVEGI